MRKQYDREYKKRYTKWTEWGYPIYDGPFSWNFSEEDEEEMEPGWRAYHKNNCKVERKSRIMQKLAEYEDTGLTPKEVAALKGSSEEHWLELQRADLEKRLLVLPITAGCKLYVPANSKEGPTATWCIVRRISTDVSIEQTTDSRKMSLSDMKLIFWMRVEHEDGAISEFTDSFIGKSYFFTKEEAVNRAKELKMPV